MLKTKLVNHEKLLLRSSGERVNLLNPFFQRNTLGCINYFNPFPFKKHCLVVFSFERKLHVILWKTTDSVIWVLSTCEDYFCLKETWPRFFRRNILYLYFKTDDVQFQKLFSLLILILENILVSLSIDFFFSNLSFCSF
jgi:hypothetical protein